jgi:hypothetical protein
MSVAYRDDGDVQLGGSDRNQVGVADVTGTRSPRPRPPPPYAQNDHSEPSARSPSALGPPTRSADLALCMVTLRSWRHALAAVVVDRFVDRVTCASGAISVIGGTTPWYPCS